MQNMLSKKAEIHREPLMYLTYAQSGAVPKGRPLVSFSSRLGLETGKIRL